jgi:hypothetical protein
MIRLSVQSAIRCAIASFNNNNFFNDGGIRPFHSYFNSIKHEGCHHWRSKVTDDLFSFNCLNVGFEEISDVTRQSVGILPLSNERPRHRTDSSLWKK